MIAMTEAEIDAWLFANGRKETPKETVERWVRARNLINKYIYEGGKITQPQADQLDFIEQKLDDWASDYDPPE